MYLVVSTVMPEGGRGSTGTAGIYDRFLKYLHLVKALQSEQKLTHLQEQTHSAQLLREASSVALGPDPIR